MRFIAYICISAIITESFIYKWLILTIATCIIINTMSALNTSAIFFAHNIYLSSSQFFIHFAIPKIIAIGIPTENIIATK